MKNLSHTAVDQYQKNQEKTFNKLKKKSKETVAKIPLLWKMKMNTKKMSNQLYQHYQLLMID